MKETWKDIADYEGLYQVSDLGRVKSCERVITRSDGHRQTMKEKIIVSGKDTHGYLQVKLWNNGVGKHYAVHRLVAEAFIPNNDLFAYTVNHKDEDKTNNSASNLEWMSLEDNIRYSQRDGGTGDNRGSKNPAARQVRCVETGQVFGCAVDASRWLGLCKTAVSTNIYKGCRAGGYHFEYLNDNIGLCNG